MSTERPVTTNEELDVAFALQRSSGAYALLIGAGVSKAAGLRSAWDVQVALIQEIAAGLGQAQPAPDEAEQWYETTFDKPARYDDMLDTLAKTRAERQALLRRYFEPTADERAAGVGEPGPAHHAIARLVAAGRVRIIVTLNFDHLIEDALRAAGITVTIASTPEAVAALVPLHDQHALVVHLHGDYTEPQSLLNTTDELRDYDPRLIDFVRQLTREYGLVMAGWSVAWDAALRDIIATTPNAFYSSWWVNPSPPRTEARDLLELRRITHITGTADDVFTRVADAADAISAAGGRSPRTLDAVASSAKRALSGATPAISLHDDIQAEFDLLRANPALKETDFSPVDVEQRFRQRLDAIVRASGPADALVATAAMWGDSTTDSWWIPEIDRLSAHDIRNGATVLLALRSYPATLVLYSAGIGAVARGRWDLAKRLLSDTYVTNDQGHLSSAGSVLNVAKIGSTYDASLSLFEHLTPMFTSALGLSRGAWEDAWQWFEYLQMLQATYEQLIANDWFTKTGMPGNISNFLQYSPPGDSTPIGEGSSDHAKLIAAELRVSSAPGLHQAHLLSAGDPAGYRPVISLALRREVGQEGRAHRLCRADFCGGDPNFLLATAAVLDRDLADAAKSAADSAFDIMSKQMGPTGRFWIDETGRYGRPPAL